MVALLMIQLLFCRNTEYIHMLTTSYTVMFFSSSILTEKTASNINLLVLDYLRNLTFFC